VRGWSGKVVDSRFHFFSDLEPLPLHGLLIHKPLVQIVVRGQTAILILVGTGGDSLMAYGWMGE
jgi:hypothetical protein